MYKTIQISRLSRQLSPFSSVTGHCCCFSSFAPKLKTNFKRELFFWHQNNTRNSQNIFSQWTITTKYLSQSPCSYNKLEKKERHINPDTGEEYVYDQKHEQYEMEAKIRGQKIQYMKKIFSSILFVTTLVAVMFARRRKQTEVTDNLVECTFIKKDDHFHGSYNTFCRYGAEPSSPVLPASIVRDGTIKTIKSFQVRPTDVFVASFPKTGTTWIQEIVYRIKGQQNLADSSDTVLENRFPFLEYPYPGIGAIVKQTSARFIKTHLPYDLLPSEIQNAKLIYVTRNPKDTVVSYYHFARMLTFSSYDGTFEEFLTKFKNSELPYTPFFSHIDGYLSHSNDPNVLIVTYEELSRDPANVIRRIGVFLERSLSEEDVQSLVVGTSFQKMSTNAAVNYEHWDELGIRNKNESHFMRKGTVGDWRNYFTAHMNEEFNAWVADNNKSGFKFEYEM